MATAELRRFTNSRAMSASDVLRIDSSPRMFGLLQPAEPMSASVGHWTVRELYTPNVHHGIHPRLGSYQVVLEAEVDLPAEVEDRFSEGVEIAEQLEHLWLYATGSTLHGNGFSLALANVEPPGRWQSNVKEVRRAAQARHFRITGEVSVQSRHWHLGSMLPLRSALKVRNKYALADDITRALAGLHYHAHTARALEEGAFLLAKALELVRKILPGRTDLQREASLPAQVRASLELSLHALYDLSNTRFDTRHAARRTEVRD
jgi:hypothetical protein